MIVIGHRGAAALAPENSLAAIEAAAAHGADAVELDVQPGLVLAHGPDIPRDAPALEDALDLARDLGLRIQLDVKHEGLEGGIVAALRERGLVERSFVSSYSLPILRALAAVEPALARSFTYPEDRHGVSERRLLRPAVRPGLAALRRALPRRLPRWLRAAEAQAATLNHAVVSRAAVEVCHGLGVAVYVWTVNEPALARTLAESDIDGIITDDPRIFVGGMSDT